MGLAATVVDAIIREHAYRPITGDVLLIGRQTIYLTPDEALGILRAHGLVSAIDVKDIALDRETHNRRSGLPPRDLISDVSLFALLGNRTVKALDHSDYEGAEVVHDLTAPVPEHLKGCADFIVDGSTLDNTFTPALVLKNYAELLRPGGRLVAINALSNHHDPYVTASPGWYLDYFVMNRFADCKVYVLVHMGDQVNVFCVDPDCLLDPARRFESFKAPFELAVVVMAEKAADSTTSVWPTQGHYRSEQAWSTYRQNLAQMARSRRPHLMRSWGGGIGFSPLVSGYLFMDEQYQALDPLTEERRQQLAAERREWVEAQRRFEATFAGRVELGIKRLARAAGYELVKPFGDEGERRAAEMDAWTPHTAGAKARRGFLRLLHAAGYDLAKRSESDSTDLQHVQRQQTHSSVHDPKSS